MKRTLAVLIALVTILLGVLVALPLIFGDKLISLAKEKANQSINARVDFEDYDITVFKSFPDLTLLVNNLKISGVGEFEGVDLASIKSFGITVDLKSVISGKTVVVKGLEIERPNVNILVLENGHANYDISKPSEEEVVSEDGTTLKIALKEYFLEDANITYNDKSLGFYTELKGVDHSGKGDFTLDLFSLKTKTEIENLTVAYGGVKYLKRIPAELNAELEMDMTNMRFTFKENTINLNKLELGINGKFEMPDEDMIFDLSLGAKKTDFKNILSLLPAEYIKDFDKVKVNGKLGLNAHLKGVFNDRTMPGFDVNLLVENGSVKYPDLPKSAENINILASIVSPGGRNYDNTVVNVSRFHLDVANNPIDATLILKTPISDPEIDTKIMAQLDLNNIKDVMPMENTNLKGRIKADVAVKGKMSDLEAQRYEAFEASGYVELSGFLYKSDSLPKPLTINNALLKFNPRKLELTNFLASFGQSKIKANGELSNYLSYVLKNDTLNGTLYLHATNLNLNEFTSGSSSTSSTATTTEMSVIKVPANINFQLHSAIDNLVYDKMVISQFAGDLIVRDQTIRFDNNSMKMLGGYAVINGSYSTKKAEPEFSLDIDVNRLDINKTANTLNTVALMAPIAKNATGTFAAKFNVAGKLNDKMEPQFSTMNGGGITILSNVFFENFEPFNRLAQELKVSRLTKQKIADSKIQFEITGGKIVVKPFDTKFGPISARIAGSNSITQEIDYVMNLVIPKKEFGEGAGKVMEGLLSRANSAVGTEMTIPENFDLEVFITNTVTDPKIRTNLKERGKSAIDDAKKKLQEEVDKKKQELETKAKEEVDKARREAEERARQEADRLKQEAEQKAKEKLNSETEKAKEEAKKKIKGLFGKP